ncbi:Ankyrin repeat family protein [Euphorbia peplus]|nr:Ankyrin repeat family protein [Euphorbia peplus]
MGKAKQAGEEEVHAAARSGDLNGVESILSSKPLLVNSRDRHSRTPLHLAAWSGHADVVSYLCQNKADVGAAAMDDMGAIHFAAQKGHLEIVKTLVSSGVSVKSCTRKGLTPLHFAAQGSYLELVKYLVKKGASLAAQTKAGKTPLDLANNEEIVSFLEESMQSSSKKGNTNTEEKAEESNAKPSLPEKSESCGEVNASRDEEEEEGEFVKRKGEKDHDTEEAPSEQKRRKITLNHLVTEDDTEQEENL